MPGASFSISRYEVSVSFYNQFAHATGRRTLKGSGNFPATRVSHKDALDFVRFLNTADSRFALPTQREWKTGVTGGSPRYDYAWGLDSEGSARYAVCLSANCISADLKPINSGAEPTILGIFHAHGNVREWLADCSGSRCLVVGGGYRDRPEALAISAARALQSGTRDDETGFRLIRHR